MLKQNKSKLATKHGLVSEVEDKKQKKKLFEDIFRIKKFRDDYSVQEIGAIEACIYNDKNKYSSKYLINEQKSVVLYGSSIFKGNVLSGDIDVLQYLSIIDHPKALQEIVRDILSSDRYNNFQSYLGDIKCGLNSEYRSLANYIGTFRKGKVIGYNPKAIKYAMKAYTEERKEISTTNENESSSDDENKNESSSDDEEEEKKIRIPFRTDTKKDKIDYLKLYSKVHDIITRRWTHEDITNGYQVDKDGKEYSLKTACFESELTKVDVYYIGSDAPFFIEATNVLMNLANQKKYNESIFKDSLILDMLSKYYVDKNKLKAIKRLYALVRKDKDIDLTLKLHDFTQRSLTGKYNVLINNFKVFKQILENNWTRYNEIDAKSRRNAGLYLRRHLSHIESKLQIIYNPYVPYLTELVDQIGRMKNEIVDTEDRGYTEDIVKYLLDTSDKIIDYFSQEIDKACTEFIKINNINFEKYLM
jgi:hypothetical protein